MNHFHHGDLRLRHQKVIEAGCMQSWWLPGKLISLFMSDHAQHYSTVANVAEEVVVEELSLIKSCLLNTNRCKIVNSAC